MKNKRGCITAVTIAASDSGGGAGIQADLLTFAAHGLHAATVLVAVTAQDTSRIYSMEPLSPSIIRRQMDAVFPDLRPSAVKIGALYDEARVRAVAAGLERHRARNVVLDPVLAAKGGRRLLVPAAVRALTRELFPLCDLVTPNLPEAESLSGIRIRDDASRRDAARALAAAGAKAVLVKGGHFAGEAVTDLLFDGKSFFEFRGKRRKTRATHGLGCTLSSAIAANLALGSPLKDAVRLGIEYLRAALDRGIFPGRGCGTPGRLRTRAT
ncbi:MAG TPA: bifunctional hydroxymethylpyrimidine kinase/phosphomethylpyrimidine kinase [Thermoanaerobaculia bacterium]|nr:bifunctional hydroxymethylpyrimidine kinase/phosphomethylpyrimidine kinase [Thermoanaerobaculia bacterium]